MWRRLAHLSFMVLALCVSARAMALGDAAVAWLGQDGVQWRMLDGSAKARSDGTAPYPQVPLGSLWKLFVYAYASELKLQEPPFQCGAQRSRRSEEEYCCDPGQSVGRDLALVRSCGRYFEPARLHIEAQAWQQFWATRTEVSANWLGELDKLRPDTQVSVDALLQALAAIPVHARDDARQALIGASLQGYARETLAQLGTAARMKTFSWAHPQKPGVSFGGAAGWLPDGTPFWFGASGSSRTALTRWAPALQTILRDAGKKGPAQLAASYDAEPCVDVDFFSRYPLREVSDSGRNEPARAGALRGRYKLDFANGNQLNISAGGELMLQRDQGRPRIHARFALNDYVARVLDREGDARETAAAQALAVAVRSYVVQNGVFESGCYRIADDSRTQRVSPNSPSAAALDAAWFSDGLIVKGTAVRYHLDQAAPGVLSWRAAQVQSRQGLGFDKILRQAYPSATFSSLGGLEDCRRHPGAEKWLAGAQPRWSKRLAREPGYELLREAIAVCALDYGNPYSDQRRLRIYVRDGGSLQDRLTLAHEYLHLAFRFHPNGLDERYVEHWARKLIDG